jgi:hypothetical protein
MATSRRKPSKRKAPWNKAAPKSARHTKLSPGRKAQAKRSAKRAAAEQRG